MQLMKNVFLDAAICHVGNLLFVSIFTNIITLMPLHNSVGKELGVCVVPCFWRITEFSGKSS